MRNIKAKFSEGVLIPQERLDLKEGVDVVISIAASPQGRTLEALRTTAGAWKGTHDPEALKQAIYAGRRTSELTALTGHRAESRD